MATAMPLVPEARSPLLALVDERSGQRIMSCYQCGKCSAGCPMASSSDLGPHQVIRAVQLGARELALGNEMLWLCLACECCRVRCPREIEVPAVMDALRHIALAEGRRPAARDLLVFHRAFLATVKRCGRSYELGIGGLFNGLSGRPLTNTALLPRMLAKGKLGLLPDRAEGASEVKAIFERVAELERDAGREEVRSDG